jgi:hypothetical protein
MSVTCDRVVTAQRETRRPGDPEQRADLRFYLDGAGAGNRTPIANLGLLFCP